MPIAFPPQKYRSILTDASTLGKVRGVQFAPKLSTGIEFPFVNKRNGNVRNLGKPYQAVVSTSVVNPVNTPLTDRMVYDRKLGQLNMSLSGVSRDAAGAVLGNCQVLIFRTEDRSLVAETVSDGSGNWTISLLKGGPFFLVEYKTGSPDVFGTTPNTLVPIQS